MAIAPAIPSNKPITFLLDSTSAPTIADRKSTMSGVEVLIIEPSIGDVCANPYIIHTLRPIPISIAAPKIFSRSAATTFSALPRIRGASESNAAITNDAATIAIGEIYRPRTRL